MLKIFNIIIYTLIDLNDQFQRNVVLDFAQNHTKFHVAFQPVLVWNYLVDTFFLHRMASLL